MLIVCLYYFCFVCVVLTEKMQVFQFDFSMSPIMVHNVRTLYALWVVIFWIASSSNYSFYSGISQISLPPCWVLGSRSVFLGLIVVLLLPTQNHKHTHKHTLNTWLGSPPSGQRSRCWPVHVIYHGSPLCSAPLDPVQHLFSHQGMLCWRGMAMPLYRLALPSWGSGEDEVWDSPRQNVNCT